MHVGELSCIDRCVIKYMETQNLVGTMMQDQQVAQQIAAQNEKVTN
jgi:Tim10/DDP family zinc finger